jgi:hypothetical protein
VPSVSERTGIVFGIGGGGDGADGELSSVVRGFGSGISLEVLKRLSDDSVRICGTSGTPVGSPGIRDFALVEDTFLMLWEDIKYFWNVAKPPSNQ